MTLQALWQQIQQNWFPATLAGFIMGATGLYLTLATDEKKRGLLMQLLRALMLPFVFVVVAIAEIGLGVPGPYVLATAVALLSGWAILRTRHYRTNVGELADAVKSNSDLIEENARLKRENAELTTKLDSSITYVKEKRERWDEIKRITYGFINYYPLLYEKSGEPSGLGVDYLRKLFPKHVEIVSYGVEVNWKAAVELLKAGKFDIVATPLFATFSRSRDIAFSMPLFFSNIGLFASKNLAKSLDLGGPTDLTTVLKAIARKQTVKFLTVDEEISEHLGKKYAPDRVCENEAKTKLSKMFIKIRESQETENDLVIFSESFTAWASNEAVKRGDIVNLLKPHQILYPVCFAVRRGDYQLVNLLNIKLLEIAEDTRGGGVLADLAARLVADHAHIEIGDVYAHFVARWPVTAINGTGANGAGKLGSTDGDEPVVPA